MSREELVNGYAAGHVGRRVFVKGLVALGVTGAAAIAYADALAAAPAPRAAGGVTADLYDLYPPATTPPSGSSTVAGGGVTAPVDVQPTFTG
jgi:hypothetical protein